MLLFVSTALLLFLAFKIYQYVRPPIESPRAFDVGYISEISISIDGTIKIISDVNEIDYIKKFFEGYYYYSTYPNKCSSPENEIIVSLKNNNNTVVLSPTGDDCGYYLNHRYFLNTRESPIDFISYINNHYFND